ALFTRPPTARHSPLPLHDALPILAVHAIVKGRVARLESYGAFVDLGGVEGLLHVSNLAHRRVEHPEELLKLGQEIEVVVISIERSEEHTSELQSRVDLVCRLLLEK